MHNILTDQLIRMDTRDRGRVSSPLPDVYAALMEDEVDAFPALRPHQRHAWHAFLVQLGAMALRRAGASEPPADSKAWAALIRGLTPDYPDDEPWHLVIDDITKPAFMQSPASSADKRAEYKPVDSPDELDMLVTSRNHDLKSAVASSAEIDDWLFALIALQTTSAQDGRGNYPVSRIKSAYSARPAFSLAPTHGVGSHVFRDIRVLLAQDQKGDNGIALVWTIPWDGAKSEALAFSRLDPLYIEICRRVRLELSVDRRLACVRAGSLGTRIEAKALRGRTGDPWTPIDNAKGEALNIGPAGFTYKSITKYLTDPDWEWPDLLEATPEESLAGGGMQLVARSLRRNTMKQGMTERYDERIVPLKHKVFGSLGRSRIKELGDIAKERIEEVRKVQTILNDAVATFLAHGKELGDLERNERRRVKDKARNWSNKSNKLDEIVDASFFDALQDEFEEDDLDKRSSIRDEWLLDVVKAAWRILGQAQDSLPCPAIQRYRARERSDSVFECRIHSSKDGLPSLFTEKGDDE